MNWDALGALGEIVGATAVVVSLVYLASQVRRSNELAQENAYRELQRGLEEAMSDLTRDKELHALWRDALYEGKDISDLDRERLGFIFQRSFGSLNVAYHASRRDPRLQSYCVERLDVYLANPVIRSWWRRQRKMQPEPFRTLVDKRADYFDQAESTDEPKST